MMPSVLPTNFGSRRPPHIEAEHTDPQPYTQCQRKAERPGSPEGFKLDERIEGLVEFVQAVDRADCQCA